ncbi:unnamed protein product [Periconia digitata]|uniref:DUF6532 domain-containing protein n=1 Tax=Periconia digitata TaxID=1303443 RepID=A0A9W4U5S0_9PLEO|nr:unnamed protein product [Periconia digitata]
MYTGDKNSTPLQMEDNTFIRERRRQIATDGGSGREHKSRQKHKKPKLNSQNTTSTTGIRAKYAEPGGSSSIHTDPAYKGKGARWGDATLVTDSMKKGRLYQPAPNDKQELDRQELIGLYQHRRHNDSDEYESSSAETVESAPGASASFSSMTDLLWTDVTRRPKATSLEEDAIATETSLVIIAELLTSEQEYKLSHLSIYVEKNPQLLSALIESRWEATINRQDRPRRFSVLRKPTKVGSRIIYDEIQMYRTRCAAAARALIAEVYQFSVSAGHVEKTVTSALHNFSFLSPFPEEPKKCRFCSELFVRLASRCLFEVRVRRDPLATSTIARRYFSELTKEMAAFFGSLLHEGLREWQSGTRKSSRIHSEAAEAAYDAMLRMWTRMDDCRLTVTKRLAWDRIVQHAKGTERVIILPEDDNYSDTSDLIQLMTEAEYRKFGNLVRSTSQDGSKQVERQLPTGPREDFMFSPNESIPESATPSHPISLSAGNDDNSTVEHNDPQWDPAVATITDNYVLQESRSGSKSNAFQEIPSVGEPPTRESCKERPLALIIVGRMRGREKECQYSYKGGQHPLDTLLEKSRARLRLLGWKKQQLFASYFVGKEEHVIGDDDDFWRMVRWARSEESPRVIVQTEEDQFAEPEL